MNVLQRLLAFFTAVPNTPASDVAVMEKTVYNPLGVRCGNCFTIDTLDLRELNFRVVALRENIRKNAGNTVMADVLVKASPLDGEDVQRIIRLVPDPGSVHGIPFRAVVLELVDEMAFNRSLEASARMDQFIETENGTGHRKEYQRAASCQTPWECEAKMLADADGSGKVDPNEVDTAKFEINAFNRKTQLEGVEVEEHIYVEMNKEDGWQQIWRGTEVHPARLTVY